ncbi:putative reverse transcriptase domain-containing protein [Tanacetum coccineum]
MADDVAEPSVSVSRPRPSSGPVPSFRDVSRDAIHANFFLFSAGPYYATYPEGGVARNCEFIREEWDALYRPTFRVLTKEVFKDHAIFKTVVDQFPTPGEMVRVESLSDDQLTVKMSVLHCMMMSHGSELLARYRGVYLEEAGFRLNNKLSSPDASFAKSKAKCKERKKKIKSLTKSLDKLHAEVARLSSDLNRATILEAKKDEEILYLKATPLEFSSFFQGQFQGLKMANFMPGAQDRLAEASLLVAQTDYAFLNKISEHATEPLSVILQLEPKKLACLANVPFKGYAEMTDGAAPSKSGGVFVQGISHVLDDVAEVTVVRSERVSSGPNDIVVSLSVGEKGDGSLPSSAVDEVDAINPSRVQRANIAFRSRDQYYHASLLDLLITRSPFISTDHATKEIEFQIELTPGATPVAKSPYRLTPSELEELSGQLKEFHTKVSSTKVGTHWGASVAKRSTVTWACENGKWIHGRPYCDYDCEIRYYPGKANVVANALSRKERVKPKRVKAMNMTLQSSIKKGLDEMIEQRSDGTLYYLDQIWVPLKGEVITLIMNEAHKSKYSVHPGADKMYYELRDRTSSGHDTIWVIMDRLTKSAHFLPMREDYKMERLARLYLNEIVARHGTRLDISTAYHPQTDGQSEHTIQTLEYMLRAYVLDFEGSWDVYLLLVEFSYNNSYHSSVRCAPVEALYGRKCCSPIMWAEVGEGQLIGPELV